MLENLLVVKVGSNSNFDFEENRINIEFIKRLCEDASLLYSSGTYPIFVLSGAIPIGMKIYGFEEKPEKVDDLQMCAGVGQTRLVIPYQRFLEENGLRGSQLLVTYRQLEEGGVQNLYEEIGLEHQLKNNTIPLINYNDPTDPSEARQDNDELAKIITMQSGAKRLILLTDVDGLKDDDNLVGEIRDSARNYLHLCTRANSVSGGGMETKLEIGAELQHLGITTYIGNSMHSLSKILIGNPATIIYPI